MLNALRQADGFEVELFRSRTGLPWETVARTMQLLQARGLTGSTGTLHFPTALGLLFLNDVLLQFLPENEPESSLSSVG
jgi:hypothetical protein